MRRWAATSPRWFVNYVRLIVGRLQGGFWTVLGSCFLSKGSIGGRSFLTCLLTLIFSAVVSYLFKTCLRFFRLVSVRWGRLRRPQTPPCDSGRGYRPSLNPSRIFWTKNLTKKLVKDLVKRRFRGLKRFGG